MDLWTGMILTYPEHLSTIVQMESQIDPSSKIRDGRDRKSIAKRVNGFVGIGSGLAKPYSACFGNMVS